MKTGKYGIRLSFYAAAAFVLAGLGQVLLCGLVLAFAILAEQDRWLNRQAIQAFCLSLVPGVVSRVIDVVDDVQRIPFLGNIFRVAMQTITGLVTLLVLILAILGIVQVLKEKDAGIPVLSSLAEKLCPDVQQQPELPGSDIPQPPQQ